jgi:hypothetical protein
VKIKYEQEEIATLASSTFQDNNFGATVQDTKNNSKYIGCALGGIKNKITVFKAKITIAQIAAGTIKYLKTLTVCGFLPKRRQRKVIKRTPIASHIKTNSTGGFGTPSANIPLNVEGTFPESIR